MRVMLACLVHLLAELGLLPLQQSNIGDGLGCRWPKHQSPFDWALGSLDSSLQWCVKTCNNLHLGFDILRQ